MSGLVKAKKYQWKDSNMALFGSDKDKKVKKESAKTEPAWEGAGKKPGLQIWRIVKFEVTHWPKEKYGQFYDGDSYIILHTRKDPNSNELFYDVHFWIGAESTQDEYGTAAYKTVELDILLDDKPVQHRQVQDHETRLFISYFNKFTVLSGGADSGFNPVAPEKYQTRLLEVKIVTDENGKKKQYVLEKPLKKSSMNNGDVYIIDKGLHLIQWCGQDASPFERNKAKEICIAIDEERSGKAEIEVLDDQDVNDMPQSLLALLGPDSGASNDDRNPTRQPCEKKLNKLSDKSGQLIFTEIASGDAIKRSQLDTNDVFILETQEVCFVWLGGGASIDEKRNAFPYAHNYIMRSVNPFNPITVVDEGHETQQFNRCFRN